MKQTNKQTNKHTNKQTNKQRLRKGLIQSQLIKGNGFEARQHQRSKQRCQDLYWKVHDPAQSFVLLSYTMHELRNNTFLLVSSSVRSKQLLCCVQGQGQKREQKHTTKNLVGFHNHFPLLTMIQLNTQNISESYRVKLRCYVRMLRISLVPLNSIASLLVQIVFTVTQ